MYVPTTWCDASLYDFYLHTCKQQVFNIEYYYQKNKNSSAKSLKYIIIYCLLAVGTFMFRVYCRLIVFE